MTHADSSRHSGADNVERIVLIIVGIVLTTAALKLASAVLIPLVAGIFLAVLVRPLQLRVREAMPRRLRWVGLTTAMLVLLAGVVAFGGALALSGRAVTDEFRARRPAIEQGLERMRATARRMGLPIPAPLEKVAGADSANNAGAGGAPQRTSETDSNASSETSAASGSAPAATSVLRTFGAALGGLGLALAFAALGLAEADDVRHRISRLGRNGSNSEESMGTGARRALRIVDETAPAFRRYVWVKSLTSVITGLATWLLALAFGLPLAWVWGFLAFLFEYVPTIGSLLAVVPPTLMALADGGPARAGLVLVTIGAMQVMFGNVIDPRLEGRLMSISPFGVLLSIVFWGWLWGAVGALLAVPLTVALVIACRHTPGARGVARLVAGDDEHDGKKADNIRAE
jgi:AI-2 transport protein TqsA